MRVKREASMAWHTLISGLGLIAWARGHATASGETTEERVRAQAAEGLLLHRQQQVSACATTVVSMSRMGYHDGRNIDVYFDDWKSPAIGSGAPGYPDGLHWEPFAFSWRFFDLARCAPTFRSRLKIEINGTPPSSSLLFPKRSKSITARSAVQLAFSFVSVACRCIKKRGVSPDFSRDICASDSNYNTHRGRTANFLFDSPDGNETELTSRCVSRAGANGIFRWLPTSRNSVSLPLLYPYTRSICSLSVY